MARSITAAAFGRSDRTIMVAAILLAAIAAVLVFVAANSGGDSGPQAVTPVAGGVEVVTAVKDIAANTTITADMVQVTSLPAAAVLAQAYTATDGLVGLSTRYPVLAGEQVTPNKVGTSVKDDKSLALVVKPGQRAIAIPVNEESMVGGLLLPGDFVDVIALISASNSGSADMAVTLVQNVEVLAVGQEAQDAIPRAVGGTDTAGGTSGQVPDNADAQPNASTITLSVTPEQAQLIALAADKGALWTSLRSRGDNAAVDLGQTDLGQFQAPAEAAPAE